ncbi:MAG TPA: hypothetical protein VIJ50_12590 [Solirubrobacteraceae bacterium]
MDYQLTITFAELGHRAELPDRLLTILLERLPDTGPTLAHNQATGTLTVLLSFASVAPFEEVSRLSKALGLALLDAGVETSPTVIDVHVVAIHESDEDPTALPGVLSLA